MRSPWASASTIESKIALMITSESRRDRCGNRLFTSSMRSLFVMSFSPKREVVLVVQPFGRVEKRVPSSFPFSATGKMQLKVSGALLEHRWGPLVSEPATLASRKGPAENTRKQSLPPALLSGAGVVHRRICPKADALGGHVDRIVQRTEVVNQTQFLRLSSRIHTSIRKLPHHVLIKFSPPGHSAYELAVDIIDKALENLTSFGRKGLKGRADILV